MYKIKTFCVFSICFLLPCMHFSMQFLKSSWRLCIFYYEVIHVNNVSLNQRHGRFIYWLQYSTAKSLQSCLTLWSHRQQPTRLRHPWDSPGKNTGVGCRFLLQCLKVKVKSLSRVWFLATPWTAAYQAPPSMEFSRQEYWSGVPLPSPQYSTDLI